MAIRFLIFCFSFQSLSPSNTSAGGILYQRSILPFVGSFLIGLFLRRRSIPISFVIFFFGHSFESDLHITQFHFILFNRFLNVITADAPVGLKFSEQNVQTHERTHACMQHKHSLTLQLNKTRDESVIIFDRFENYFFQQFPFEKWV